MASKETFRRSENERVALDLRTAAEEWPMVDVL
jgi:hypothetical protein